MAYSYLEAVRKRGGPDLDIGIELYESFSIRSALQFADSAAPLKPMFLAEPIWRETPQAFGGLAARSRCSMPAEQRFPNPTCCSAEKLRHCGRSPIWPSSAAWRWRRDSAGACPVQKDGLVELPNGPGLGIRIDFEQLAKRHPYQPRRCR